MKTVYPDENNVVLNENSVGKKPCINRESKSLELTINLYSCHDINMKFLLVVTPPSIYQTSSVAPSQPHLPPLSHHLAPPIGLRLHLSHLPPLFIPLSPAFPLYLHLPCGSTFLSPPILILLPCISDCPLHSL